MEKLTLGYIEAKILEKNLDEIEGTDQFDRYSTTYPNFILTNFILYEKGKISAVAKISSTKSISGLESRDPSDDPKLMSLFERFFLFTFPKIQTAEALAVELAKRTRFLRDEVMATEIEEEEKSGNKRILGFYEAFQTYLIEGMKKAQFADIYSQTLTYGLFAARMQGRKDFNRKTAVYDIPRTIGILKDIFEFISLGDIPDQMVVIIDEISSVLASVDVKRIFSQYFKSGKGQDPVFMFYEKFLEEYDPEQRERRGVYYTPESVVSYIVRSCHAILKQQFQLTDGLAEKSVTILDPAGGTLTFLAQAIREATKEFSSKYGDGGREQFIREHILRDFYAFELLFAPYAIGHLKVAFLLEELGYNLQGNEKTKFYLTNTLDKGTNMLANLPLRDDYQPIS